MFLLVEVGDMNDVGKNELRRLKLSDQYTIISPRCEHVKNISIVFDIVTTGVEVHPATVPEDVKKHTINDQFTDVEFEEIESIRKKTGMNWHDFILRAAHALNAGGE